MKEMLAVAGTGSLRQNGRAQAYRDHERRFFFNDGVEAIKVQHGIEALPNDCLDKILRFLKLKDCLAFCSCSKKCMAQSIPHLHLRRCRQFYGQYAYQKKKSNVLRLVYPNYYEKDKTEQDCSIKNEEWIFLPPIKERIMHLYHHFPFRHPLEDKLKKLVFDLDRNLEACAESYEPLTNILFQNEDFRQGAVIDFDLCFQLFCQATRAHHLHFQLLHSCTIGLVPVPHFDPTIKKAMDRGNRRRTPTSPLTVTLSQYMGDVLCASYLMGHSNSRIIEGSPKINDWADFLHSQIAADESMNNKGQRIQRKIEATSCYDLWVFIHSLAVQNGAFSRRQLESIGLHPDWGVTAHDHTGHEFVAPYTPFTCTKSILEMEEGKNGTPILDLLQKIEIPLENHYTKLIEFGPAAPAYQTRRDYVQTKRMPLPVFSRAVLRTMAEQQFIDADDRTTEESSNSDAALFTWLHHRDGCVEWMADLYRFCNTALPMALVTPVVEILPAEMTL